MAGFRRVTAALATAALAGGIIAGCSSTESHTQKVSEEVSEAESPTTPAPAAVSTGGSHVVDITMSEFQFKMPSRIPVGHDTFRIHNAGHLAHELLVFHSTVPVKAWPKSKDGDVDEDAAGMNKISDGDNVSPGATQTRNVDIPAPGTYEVVCNLPGHFDAGMYKVVSAK